jgi:hypothetical protein
MISEIRKIYLPEGSFPRHFAVSEYTYSTVFPSKGKSSQSIGGAKTIPQSSPALQDSKFRRKFSEEGEKNMFRNKTFQVFFGFALVLASPILFPTNNQALAQDNSKGDTREMTKVFAHIPLPGSPVRQIFYQEENGRRYLYLQQNVHFTVVDVTDAQKPQIVDRVATGGKLSEIDSGLAILVSSDQSGEGTVPTQTIKLMDMTDPKNPRTVKTFTGVTSIYSEDGRHLIYITNNEGLWIVKHSMSHRLPLCTSESAENTVAQCL